METLWIVAETAYALAALASVACAAAIARWAPGARNTRLVVASLSLLGVHYGAAAIDAGLQVAGTAHGRFTVWNLTAHALAVLAFSALLLVLLSVATRLAPRGPRHTVTGAMVLLQVGVASITTLGLLLSLAVDVVSGVPAEMMQARVRELTRLWGLASSPLLLAPVPLLHLVWQRRPSAAVAGWIDEPEGEAQRAGAWDPDGRGAPFPARLRDGLRGLLGIYLGATLLEALRWVGRAAEWTPLTLSLEGLSRLALLPCAVAVVYYHARFVFFAVVLTRGLVFLGLFTVIAPAVWWLAATPPPATALVSVAVTAAVYGAGRALEHVQDWLERIVFRRPCYDRDLQRLFTAMARSGGAIEPLTQTVRAGLARAFSTREVSYGPAPSDAAVLTMPVGAAERPRGYLSLGSRARGQQYTREDVTFVTAVAAFCAALLERLDTCMATSVAQAAEARALRAQINPHFFFNALNAVADMVHGTPAAEQTVLNLSRVCRYALESTYAERVPLEDELTAVRAYLDIEAERFENRLAVHMDVPDDVRAIAIPPMLLQPLVENAVTHGLGPSVRGGSVCVVARRAQAMLHLTVSDDGIGCRPEHLTPRVGLSNVFARVRAIGGTCQLHSTPGRGTTVALRVPTP